MNAKVEQTPATNLNPVLNVAKEGTVLYSNKAGEPILNEWGVRVGEKLPSSIGDLVQRVISQNNPEKIEVKVGKKVYLVVFHPLPEEECVKVSGFDMSDQKEADGELRESEALEMANLELSKIVDAHAIQSLMDDFYKLSHIPMSIDDLKGNVLVGVGWQDICTKFHRINPETCRYCVESSTTLSKGVLHGEFKQYMCKNNMWHIVTPIMVSGQHVGNIISGQFLFEDEPLDYELFCSKARKYGFNEKEYIAALKKVPRLSRKVVDTGISFFMKLANLISQLSYSNTRLAHLLSERDALLESLQTSESKYRNIVETAIEGLWIFNSVSETTYVNEKMAEMLGYNRKEMIGSFIWDYADEEDKDSFQVRLANRKQGIDEVYECKLLRKNGSPIWLLVSAKASFNKDGKFLGSLSMFTDITERKKAEEALIKAHDNLEKLVEERTTQLEKAYKSLKENEESLAEAQKMAHVGNWEWDVATDKAYWSDELYRIFGYSPQELAPTYNEFLNYIHPDDRHYVDNAANKALNEKSSLSVDFRIILADGKECTVHMLSKIIFDEKNFPIRIKGVVQDITERKKAEEKLRKSEEKYRNIVETANEGISLLNSEGTVTYVNKKLADMLDCSSEEMIGRPAWDFVAPDYIPINKLQLEKRRLGVSESYEIKLNRKDGSPIWVSINAKSIFDDGGKYIGSLSMHTDITNRKEAEKALSNIEIARKKEIHHRIKNNLQVISSLLDLQAEQFNGRKNIKDEEVLNAFKESKDRVISMALIHEELHKGGGIDVLNFSQYIEELTDKLFQTYRLGDEGISLDIDIEENIFFDMDTSVPLGIIVNELVSNSLKHAFSGRDKGEIRIKLRRVEKGACKNEGYKRTDYIFFVYDNGIGIPQNLDIEELDSLGLQLVTSLVEQLDGELELKRDGGTTFIIRFTATQKYNEELVPATEQSVSNARTRQLTLYRFC